MVGQGAETSTPGCFTGSQAFFMLGQVVGDPWVVEPKTGSGCEDVAWVSGVS